MTSRRALIAATLAAPLMIRSSPILAFTPQDLATPEGQPTLDAAESADPSLTDLEYPSFDSLKSTRLFGNQPPSLEQLNHAKDVVNATPHGPTAFAIAQSFVDRFSLTNPRLISQWPKPEAWNPLVVEFFKATTLNANNDMVPWCAAFANWCLERAGKKSSKSAASQSFLDDAFERTSAPKVGDLAVFTCFKPGTQVTVGLGHVGFVASLPSEGFIEVLGGNQTADGHASIISRKKYATGDRSVYRTIRGKKTPCTMRLNTYIKVI